MTKVAAIIINRDRPELADRVFEQVGTMGHGMQVDRYLVECGSSKAGTSRHATHRFFDPSYRGRYYGFYRGLQFAERDGGPYDFYWFVVNDITFPEGEDTLAELVGAMAEDPKMGLIGPGEPDAEDYRGCHPQAGRRWHKASTVHGLAQLIRGEVIRKVGYMNHRFHYSQGAGTEYAYKLYSEGWFLAYSDVASLEHDTSGSTYGKVVRISRHEYHRRARRFASRYLRNHYGDDWDDRFTAVLPDDVEENTYPWQRKVWETKLSLNPKDFCPWFWKLGSLGKRLLASNRDHN